MTADNRTEDQKVAAVRASMTMAGYEMTSDACSEGKSPATKLYC